MSKHVKILFFSLLVLIAWDLLTGNVFKLILSSDYVRAFELVRLLRIGRVLNSLVAGADLAVVGLVLQTLFANPLAGPYILGISSGSAFGIAMGMMFLYSLGIFLGYFYSFLMALFGAVLALALILYLVRRYSLVVVIIAGVLLNGIFSALINVLQYFSRPGLVKSFVVWTMASVDVFQLKQFVILLILSVLVFVFFLIQAEKLDVLYFGESYAESFGVNVSVLKFSLLLCVGLLVAVLTASYGPIAFVGIIAPHLARIGTKSYKHRNLLLLSVLWGCVILVLADVISHSFAVVLPLNTVLSLIGLPILLYLLLRGREIIL